MKQAKIWGNTERLFEQNNVEIHRIDVRRGGYCSKHRHEHKWNAFYVEAGELKIEIWRDRGVVDSTFVRAHESTAVPPGVWHRFTAVRDTVAHEVYWVELTDDIVRITQGGVKE